MSSTYYLLDSNGVKKRIELKEGQNVPIEIVDTSKDIIEGEEDESKTTNLAGDGASVQPANRIVEENSGIESQANRGDTNAIGNGDEKC